MEEILNVYDVLPCVIKGAMSDKTRVIIHSKPDWDVEQGGFNIMIPPVVHILLRDDSDAAILRSKQRSYSELRMEDDYYDFIVSVDAHSRMATDLSGLPGLTSKRFQLGPKDFGSGLAARVSSCSSKPSFQDCLEFTAPAMPA